MKNYIFLLCSLLLTLTSCKSQELNSFEKLSRNRAEQVASYFLENENKPYILFSLANYDYIIIVDSGLYYSESILTYYEDQIKLVSTQKITKPNKLFDSSFDTNNYLSGFTSITSDFFKGNEAESYGGTTYFVMTDIEGNKYGESSLSLMVIPNPIDKKIYGYLAKKIINSFID